MQFVRGCKMYSRQRQHQLLDRTFSDIAAKVPVKAPEMPITIGLRRPAVKSAGSYYSRRLREEGFIPGVIYGKDANKKTVSIKIMVPVKPLNKQIRDMRFSFENTIQRLQLDDNTEYIVTPRQLQVDPLSDSPQSVNYLLYQPGSVMRIPLTYENAELSVDLRRGCFVATVNRYVECVCTGDVPNYLNVDLTGREKNDVIRVGSIVFPPGVRPHKTVTEDFVIAVIQSAKKA